MSSHWKHVNLAIRNALNDVSLEDLTDPARLFPLPVSPSITEDDSQFPGNSRYDVTIKRNQPYGRNARNH
jgi:hypothetical protein